MNINNGKTGIIDIPGALHSTGGDGDNQVGGVVAYTGDIYDDRLNKNQRDINKDLSDAISEASESNANIDVNASGKAVIGKTSQYSIYSNYINIGSNYDNTYYNADNNVIVGYGLDSWGGSVHGINMFGKYNNTAGWNSNEYPALCIGTGVSSNNKETALYYTNRNGQPKWYLKGIGYDDTNESLSASTDLKSYIDEGNNLFAPDDVIEYFKLPIIKIDINWDSEGDVTFTSNKPLTKLPLENSSGYYIGSSNSKSYFKDLTINWTENNGVYTYIFSKNNYNHTKYTTFVLSNFCINDNTLYKVIATTTKDNEFKGYFSLNKATSKVNINNGGNTNKPQGMQYNPNRDNYYQITVGQLNSIIANLTSDNIYDETLGKTQKEINQEIENSFSGDYNDLTNKPTILTQNDVETIVDNQSATISSSLNNLDGRITTIENDDKIVKLNNKDSIVLGDNTVVNGWYSIVNGSPTTVKGSDTFAFGSGAVDITLSGNNSVYTGNIFGNIQYNSIYGTIFTKVYKGARILSYNDGSAVAKISNATFNSTTNVLTLTLDTDLGELNNGYYTIENIVNDDSNFAYGSFGLKGRSNTSFGDFNCINGNSNVSLGSNIIDGSGGYVIGTNNKVANANGYTNIFGGANDISTTSASVIGFSNKMVANTYGNILGNSNEVSADVYAATLGDNNQFTKGSNATQYPVEYALGGGLTLSDSGVAIGEYNKDYDSSDTSVKNYFALGKGDSNTRSNLMEQKYNGDLYIKGVGGFDGTNSDTAKPLQESIPQVTDQNSVSMGTELVTDGKESIAGGAGVYIKGNRSFGYGSGLTAVYLTGSNNTYNLMIKSTSNYSVTNNLRALFADIFTNTYLRDSVTLERSAKILTVTANSDGQPITITTDTDLGEITSKSFGLENVTGDKSFTSGVFGNTGIWSNLMGYMNYSNKDYVNALGTQITNSGTYSNLFGTGIKNTETISNVIGYNVTNTGKWSSLIGFNNTNTNQANTVIGNTNTVNGLNSSIVGKNNTVNANCRTTIVGDNNEATKSPVLPSDKTVISWMLGSKLTTSFDGIALGYLNKDYPEETTTANQNYLAIGMGNGNNNDRANRLEIKGNGDLYIDRIGGYNGKNSTSSSVLPLQTIISNLQSTITSLQNRITALENQLNGGNS